MESGMATNEDRIGFILATIFILFLFATIMISLFNILIFMTSDINHDILYESIENKDDCTQFCIDDSESKWCDYVNIIFTSEQINNQTPTMKCVCEERNCIK
jgi:hypothetical protein